MSIACPTTESGSTLEQIRAQRVKRETSPARIEANRRNCLKSTGPKTTRGKRRSSRNALKHGLCRTLACLPSECEATFLTFVGELERELQPDTAMQRILFNQIASLTWRLQRLPEAQTKIFEQELAKVAMEDDDDDDDDDAPLMPSDVLARRFSDDPQHNGFALMERYERGMRNTLLRLMRQFDQLKKHRATTPYTAQEEWDAREAKYRQQLRDDEAQYEQTRRRNERMNAQHGAEDKEPVSPTAQSAAVLRAAPPRAVLTRETTAASASGYEEEQTARGGAGALPRRGEEQEAPCASASSDPTKRTQSNPPQTLDSEAPAGKCAVSALVPARNEANAEQPLDTSRIVRAGRVPPGPVECDKPPANRY